MITLLRALSLRGLLQALRQVRHTAKRVGDADALLQRVLVAFRERRIIALPSDLLADIERHLGKAST